MGFVKDIGESFDDAGLGALAPGTITSVFDPLDFAGTKSAADTKKAADEAADLQERAGKDSIANLRQAQIEAATRQQPFEQFGIDQGISQLPGSFASLQGAISDPSGAVLNNPFFQALAGQQEQRLLQSQAARGKLGSGETGDDLQRNLLLLGNQFSQQNIGNIQGQIQNQFNAATIGQNAASQTGTQGLQTAGNIGGILGNIANVGASSIMAQNQANQAVTGNLQSIAGIVAAPFTGGASLAATSGGGMLGGGSGIPQNANTGLQFA